jgi:hypothetical protein
MAMSNLNEVLEWVRTADKTNLDLVSEMIKIRRASLARTFRPGDPVKFDGGRNRGIIRGKFVKLMQKNAEVLANTGGRWRVNPALLEADDPPKPVTISVVPRTNPSVPAQLPSGVADADFEEVTD